MSIASFSGFKKGNNLQMSEDQWAAIFWLLRVIKTGITGNGCTVSIGKSGVVVNVRQS